jgi:hypothetical protein
VWGTPVWTMDFNVWTRVYCYQDYVYWILMCGDYVSAMKSIYVNHVLLILITVTVM